MTLRCTHGECDYYTTSTDPTQERRNMAQHSKVRHGVASQRDTRLAADEQTPDAMNDHVAKYWQRFYLGPMGVCGLCGDSGVVDTTRSASSPLGVVGAGMRTYCICLNGQKMRQLKSPL